MSIPTIAQTIDGRALSSLARGIRRELTHLELGTIPTHDQTRHLIARALGFTDAGSLLAKAEAGDKIQATPLRCLQLETLLEQSLATLQQLITEAENAASSTTDESRDELIQAAHKATSAMEHYRASVTLTPAAEIEAGMSPIIAIEGFRTTAASINRSVKLLADAWGEDDNIDARQFKKGYRHLVEAARSANRLNDLVAKNNNGVHPMLDCSTSHITSGDRDLLDGWSLRVPARTTEEYHELLRTNPDPIPIAAHDMGWIITVPYDDVRGANAAMRKAGLSPSFLQLIRYARARGAWKIYLHADADELDELPSHRW